MSLENQGIQEPNGIEIPGLDLTGLPQPVTTNPEEEAKLKAEEEAKTAAAAEAEKKRKEEEQQQQPPAPQGTTTEETTEEESLILDVAKRVGYEFEENETYEETEEGLANFVSTMVKKQANAELNQFLDSLPPVAGEFFDYLSMGGDPEQFFKASNPEIDFKNVDLTSSDVQKSVLRTLYRKLDFTDEEINETIEDFELQNALEKQSKLAASKLQKIQERERLELIENQKKTDKENKDKIDKYWKDVESTISKDNIKGFVVPKNEQKELFAYMSKPVQNGLSQWTMDVQKMDMEDRVLYALMVRNGFKLDKYITNSARTQQATGLRNRVAGSLKNVKSGESRTPSEGGVDIGLHNIGKS